MIQEKQQTQLQWNTTPCGSLGEITEDLEYFQKVEDHRYDEYGPWMRGFYQYHNHQNVKLLEVGFGQGTDLVQYAKGGAEVYGVDLTERHYNLAKKNFEVRGLQANLTLTDANELPFEDGFFDKVVSFGVLHHTPDIEICVKEVHRVLKPGGTFIISLYHKGSAFHYWNKVLYEGILKFGFFDRGYDGVLATIETGADGKKIKPYVKLYSRKMMRDLLKDFNSVQLEVRHLHGGHFPFSKFWPKRIIQWLEPKIGWYIIGIAKK